MHLDLNLPRAVPWALAWSISMLGAASTGPSADVLQQRSDEEQGKAPARFPFDIIGSCNGKESIPRTSCSTLKEDTYERVAAKVWQLWEGLPDDCTVEKCPQADFVGCVLRFAGHDFMDFDPFQKMGGSDGCLDFKDPDNAGLMPCLVGAGEHGHQATLQNAYADFCDEISLADFVVLAAEALMVRSRRDWNQSSAFNMQKGFKFGRPTSRTCWPGRLPNPEDSCDAVETNFINSLGLTWKEATALMGVHTVGKASPENSGYSGFWNAGPASRSFNNSYYMFLQRAGWGAQVLPNGKSQWIRVDGGPATEMMLNTDMCLLFDTPNSCRAAKDTGCCLWLDDKGLNGTATLCKNKDGAATQDSCCMQPQSHSDVVITNTCTSASDPLGRGALPAGKESADAVRLFAKDEGAWLETFKLAWRRATENNMNGLLFNPKACGAGLFDIYNGIPGSAHN